MENMQLAGCVILYNSTFEVWNNIKTYIDALDKIYIIDNSEKHNERLRAQICKCEKCRYIDLGKNKGIAYALNIAVKNANADNFQWLLTMDQDSRADFDTINQMKQYIYTEGKGDEKIICIQEDKLKRNNRKSRLQYLNETITSGSIIDISTCISLGGFRRELFIDEVDTEYCIRLIKKGYKIVRLNYLGFSHQMGNQKLCNGINTFNYPPVRYYYIIRNLNYVKEELKILGFPEEFQNEKKNQINEWIISVWHEKNRWIKYLYMLHGYIDYKIKKMGKCTWR